jgi:hypothetical protein
VINTRIEPPTEERFYLGSDTLQVPTRKVSVQLESGQWIFPKLEQSAAREWSVPRALVSTYDVSKTPTLSAPTLLELTRLIKEFRSCSLCGKVLPYNSVTYRLSPVNKFQLPAKLDYENILASQGFEGFEPTPEFLEEITSVIVGV